jgi:hypothetical protein
VGTLRPVRLVVRILVTVAVWGLGALAVLVFAAERSVGRIVWQISQNHGIHSGDLAAAAFCTLVATVITLVVWLPPYLRRRRRTAAATATAPLSGSPDLPA